MKLFTQFFSVTVTTAAVFANTVVTSVVRMSLSFATFAFNATIFITLLLYLLNSNIDVLRSVSVPVN